eukprot:1157530-Pelagomonas_calceolata.AAC.4
MSHIELNSVRASHTLIASVCELHLTPPRLAPLAAAQALCSIDDMAKAATQSQQGGRIVLVPLVQKLVKPVNVDVNPGDYLMLGLLEARPTEGLLRYESSANAAIRAAG